MPAFTSSNVGSSATTEADGTTVWPRASKKRRNRSRISAEFTAALPRPHRARELHGARPLAPRRGVAPPPTTTTACRRHHQPGWRCPLASTCLLRPSGVVQEVRRQSRRASHRRLASLCGLTRGLFGLHLFLDALAHVGLVPVVEGPPHAI